ncbi:hypothetical protein LOK49_LG01G03359 [Camellia lanceoleosa]|uniref:Uncharacterized protein n=1 Tax=Camellia lanceoleosa TaxID=1840588 RepID=A0ACC0IZH5_9ERIC|nr:hypothetical protein LOK49_LG01G03359 [Camellia lanceoleosa]
MMVTAVQLKSVTQFACRLSQREFITDRTRLMDLLKYPTMEEAIKRRVEMKAKTYGKDLTDNNNVEEDGADLGEQEEVAKPEQGEESEVESMEPEVSRV